MKQLITRIDEDLHARLKRRAASEGRSMNALVTDALEAVVKPGDLGEEMRRRAAARGIKFAEHDAPPSDPARRAAVIARTRGLGPMVDELLEYERRNRF
jgi:plasmid stability protein